MSQEQNERVIRTIHLALCDLDAFFKCFATLHDAFEVLNAVSEVGWLQVNEMNMQSLVSHITQKYHCLFWTYDKVIHSHHVCLIKLIVENITHEDMIQSFVKYMLSECYHIIKYLRVYDFNGNPAHDDNMRVLRKVAEPLLGKWKDRIDWTKTMESDVLRVLETGSLEPSNSLLTYASCAGVLSNMQAHGIAATQLPSGLTETRRVDLSSGFNETTSSQILEVIPFTSPETNAAQIPAMIPTIQLFPQLDENQLMLVEDIKKEAERRGDMLYNYGCIGTYLNKSMIKCLSILARNKRLNPEHADDIAKAIVESCTYKKNNNYFLSYQNQVRTLIGIELAQYLAEHVTEPNYRKCLAARLLIDAINEFEPNDEYYQAMIQILFEKWHDLVVKYSAYNTLRIITGKEPTCGTKNVFLKQSPVPTPEEKEDMLGKFLVNSIYLCYDDPTVEMWTELKTHGHYRGVLTSHMLGVVVSLLDSQYAPEFTQHDLQQIARVVRYSMPMKYLDYYYHKLYELLDQHGLFVDIDHNFDSCNVDSEMVKYVTRTYPAQ